MSKKSAIITIEPPVYKVDTEKLEETGFPCPYCFGLGGWVEQIGRNEYFEKKCPVCQGAKQIKAVITIGWLPDFNKKPACVKE